jgi:hypothetical protein
MPKPGPKTTTKHGDEFKTTAVRLGELSNAEGQVVARSPFIHPFMLARKARGTT